MCEIVEIIKEQFTFLWRSIFGYAKGTTLRKYMLHKW